MSARVSDLQVAVLGCGIAGLSCALTIQHRLPYADVTIVTEKLPGDVDTATDVAAGLWSPIYTPATPDEKIFKWSKRTFEYLQNIMKEDPDPKHHGIFYCPGYKLFPTEEPPPVPCWSSVPIGFRRATNRELSVFPKARSGYFYVSIMTEGRLTAKYLLKRFMSRGGKIRTVSKIVTFDEVQLMGFDYIMNCTGLGSHHLCGDRSVQPYRGQIMRIKAPWFNQFLVFQDHYPNKDTYVLPNVETIVIGGICQASNWSTEANKEDGEDILKRVYEICPQLRSASIEGTFVGLRPVRETGVKIAHERKRSERNGKPYHVFQNYGFGGSGLTIFQGCAEEATELLVQEIGTPYARL